MTIEVAISHGTRGHPAPLYVTPIDPTTRQPIGPATTLKDGDSLRDYVHQFKAFLVSERPPEIALK
jgi:hypothetical protein